MFFYFTEKIIWDENIVFVEYFFGEGIKILYKFDMIYRIFDVDFYY